LKKEDSYSQGPSDKNLNLEDGHRILPWNAGIFLQDYTVSQTKTITLSIQ
jgi:hypothetical protein